MVESFEEILQHVQHLDSAILLCMTAAFTLLMFILMTRKEKDKE